VNFLELKEEVLHALERVIRFSLKNNLNTHSSVGGKYGELWVASELWAHDPKLAGERRKIKGIRNPTSSDIVLAKTLKKVEVKWGMLHHRVDDGLVKRVQGVEFWGWGFSKGTQFLDGKFDYCVLLAAEKDGAKPEHVFVLKCEEMTHDSMGGLRRSGLSSRGSYYIEYSEDCDYYHKRRWHPEGPSKVEKALYDGSIDHKKRWEELKKTGVLS